MKATESATKELEAYLLEHGFSGDIPQNTGRKNWLVIKKLMKNHRFYTFGIKRVEQAVKSKEVHAGDVRDIMVAASGITIQRFRRHGPGHFNSAMVTKQLLLALAEIERRSKAGQRLAFATGHPGSMVGFLNGLADWAANLGAKNIRLDAALSVKDQFKVDMIGQVLVPSDNCGALHSHEPEFMDKLLSTRQVEFVVADHGFTAAALNRGIAAIGFYDTDDPGMPLAQHLGLPVMAVPINDNNYNANGAALARYLVERFGSGNPQSRRSRTRTH